MKTNCKTCGVCVELDDVKNVKIEKQERWSYNSDRYEYEHYIWGCPVCDCMNDYNTEFKCSEEHMGEEE